MGSKNQKMIDLGTTFLSSVDRCPEAIAITYQNKHLNYSNIVTWNIIPKSIEYRARSGPKPRS